jgi:hypothetical protein
MATIKVLEVTDQGGQSDVRLEVSDGKNKAETTIRVNLAPKEAEAVAIAQALKDAALHLKLTPEKENEDA